MKKTVGLLKSQGVTNADAVFHSLLDAGIVTEEVKAGNVAALVVGVTAPAAADLAEYVTDRLNATNEFQDTFGETFIQALEYEPSRSKISQVSICQNTPWAKISGIGGEIAEFTDPDFTPRGIRTEVIFSGGMIAALCMKLKFPVTESGWVEDPV